MKKSLEPDPLAPRQNLDFSKGVRGKHLNALRQGSNVVVISPDLLEAFPNSEAVNQALRSIRLKRIEYRSKKSVPRQPKNTTAS